MTLLPVGLGSAFVRPMAIILAVAVLLVSLAFGLPSQSTYASTFKLSNPYIAIRGVSPVFPSGGGDEHIR